MTRTPEREQLVTLASVRVSVAGHLMSAIERVADQIGYTDVRIDSQLQISGLPPADDPDAAIVLHAIKAEPHGWFCRCGADGAFYGWDGVHDDWDCDPGGDLGGMLGAAAGHVPAGEDWLIEPSAAWLRHGRATRRR